MESRNKLMAFTQKSFTSAAGMIAFYHYQRRISRGFPGLELGPRPERLRSWDGSWPVSVSHESAVLGALDCVHATGTGGEGHNL